MALSRPVAQPLLDEFKQLAFFARALLACDYPKDSPSEAFKRLLFHCMVRFVFSRASPPVTRYLDGDHRIGEGKVNAVAANGKLRHGLKSSSHKDVVPRLLFGRHGTNLLTGQGFGYKRRFGMPCTSAPSSRRPGLLGPLSAGIPPVYDPALLAARPLNHAAFAQKGTQSAGVEPVSSSQHRDGHAAVIKIDDYIRNHCRTHDRPIASGEQNVNLQAPPWTQKMPNEPRYCENCSQLIPGHQTMSASHYNKKVYCGRRCHRAGLSRRGFFVPVPRDPNEPRRP